MHADAGQHMLRAFGNNAMCSMHLVQSRGELLSIVVYTKAELSHVLAGCQAQQSH